MIRSPALVHKCSLTLTTGVQDTTYTANWWILNILTQILSTTCRSFILYIITPPTAKLRWRPYSSVPHVSDPLELHNNNWASWILHPGPTKSDVYSDVIQEAQSNDLLHTLRLSVRLDTPLHGNNARGAKYAVYYASVATHTVLENIKWLRWEVCRIRNVPVPSLGCLFPDIIISKEKLIKFWKHFTFDLFAYSIIDIEIGAIPTWYQLCKLTICAVGKQVQLPVYCSPSWCIMG